MSVTVQNMYDQNIFTRQTRFCGSFERNSDKLYKIHAKNAISIKFVSRPEEINMKTGQIYQPQYLHQIFGEKELIYGYKDLSIEIYFASGNLGCYVFSEYSKKQAECDDYMKKFDQWFYGHYTTSLKDFCQLLKQQKYWKPPGQKLVTLEDGSFEYEIYYMHPETSNFSQHRKLIWPLLLFYIETASFDDATPEYWRVYCMYKKYKNEYQFVGFLSKCIFQLTANKQKHRISQMLISPQFQRQGLGFKFLQVVYNDMLQDSSCISITVEVSSDNFQFIRDLMDCQLLIANNEFAWFNKLKSESVDDVEELDKIELGKEELFRLANKYKILKQQIRRAFEILLLSKLCRRNKLIKQYFKTIITNRLREEDQAKSKGRKLPLIVFNGQKQQIDQKLINEVQSQLYCQEIKYNIQYEELYERYCEIVRKLI